MDLIVTFGGRTPILFLARPTEGANDRLGPESFAPVEIIPNGEIWTTSTATLADLDGDGHLELIVANYFRDGSDVYNPQSTTPVQMPELDRRGVQWRRRSDFSLPSQGDRHRRADGGVQRGSRCAAKR